MTFMNSTRVLCTSIMAVLCFGCSASSDNSGTCCGQDDFMLSANVDKRVEELKRLLPEAAYNEITKASLGNILCRESNRMQLGLGNEINGKWYYTYDNIIRGMAQLEEFAKFGDDNLKKLEIAAFLANVAQETGSDSRDAYGGPCCFIQEGGGAYWGSQNFSEVCKPKGTCAPAGYAGRGPHQLTHDYNYQLYSQTMGAGDEYFNDPDILTRNPLAGIGGSIWFWGHTERNQWSPPNIPVKPSAHNVLTGKWTPTNASTPNARKDYNDVTCGRPKANFGIIINIINGGMECGPGAKNPTGAKNRVKFLREIAGAMGVVIPDGFIDDCSTQQPFSPCTSY
jgi:basic endochitinase B